MQPLVSISIYDGHVPDGPMQVVKKIASASQGELHTEGTPPDERFKVVIKVKHLELLKVGLTMFDLADMQVTIAWPAVHGKPGEAWTVDVIEGTKGGKKHVFAKKTSDTVTFWLTNQVNMK